MMTKFGREQIELPNGLWLDFEATKLVLDNMEPTVSELPILGSYKNYVVNEQGFWVAPKSDYEFWLNSLMESYKVPMKFLGFENQVFEDMTALMKATYTLPATPLPYYSYVLSGAPTFTPATVKIVPTPTIADTLGKVVPNLLSFQTPCPEFPGCYQADAQLASIVVHLNDDHRWRRDQIADWLDTLDVDLTIQREKELVDA